MKKHLVLFSLLIIGSSACQKIDSSTQAVTQASIDNTKIQTYLTANKLTYTKDATGVYYQVAITGTDPKPTSLSSVKITYTNAYLNGISIGRIEGIQSKLSNFIAGLQIGLVKIGTGGRINLIIPSGLAYGSTDTNSIPANSILLYTVDLVGIPAN